MQKSISFLIHHYISQQTDIRSKIVVENGLMMDRRLTFNDKPARGFSSALCILSNAFVVSGIFQIDLAYQKRTALSVERQFKVFDILHYLIVMIPRNLKRKQI